MGLDPNILKHGTTLISYLSGAGQQLREKHWQMLWDRFLSGASDDVRAAIVRKLCASDADESKFAAWLFAMLLRVDDAATMEILGKWTTHVALSNESPTYFYRVARGIIATPAEDLQSLIIAASSQDTKALRPEQWEALVFGGFVKRGTSRMTYDGVPEFPSGEYEVTSIGRDLTQSQGHPWPW
jgi:hypothetical protein